MNRTSYALGPRSHAFLAGLALALAGTLGCEPRVSLGVPCADASDCPDSLVCTFGRCRQGCDEASDCAATLECLQAGNAGGCRVAEDDVCEPTCTAGLACIDGRCAQPCTEPATCAASQTCVDGACARPAIETPLTEGSALFAPCTAPTECRAGLACATPRCLRTCQRDTMGAALTSCGPGSYCTGSDTTGGPPLTGGAGYCTQPCDPLATGPAAGCPEGFNCGIGIPSRDAYSVCEPRAADDGARWSPCNNQRCGEGLDCIYSIFPEPRCLHWCERDSDCEDTAEVCDLDLSHRITDQNSAARTVGICRPVCERVEDCESRLGLEPGSVTCTMGRCVRS